MIYFIFILYVIASALGMVLIKYGGKLSSFGVVQRAVNFSMNWIFIVGILMYIFSFFLWIYILQKFKLTYISPVAYGITFVAIALFSYLILKESLSIQQIIGTLLIIGGVFVSSIKR